MSAYVDPAVFKKPNGRKSYSHLVADTLEELHAFAASIGIKSHFFHKSASYLHYDITAEQRAIAVAAGAIQVSSRELLGKAKEMTMPIPVELKAKRIVTLVRENKLVDIVCFEYEHDHGLSSRRKLVRSYL